MLQCFKNSFKLKAHGTNEPARTKVEASASDVVHGSDNGIFVSQHFQSFSIFYVCILLPCVQFLRMLLSLIISLPCRYLQLLIILWCTRTMGLFVFIFIVSSTAHVALNIMQSASLTISAWIVSLSTFSTRTLTTDSIFTIWWMMVDISIGCFIEYLMLLL